MRSDLFALALLAAACQQPAETKSEPKEPPQKSEPADPYAAMPQCRAQCEDKIGRVRCNPPDCPKLEDCMAACREPDPVPPPP